MFKGFILCMLCCFGIGLLSAHEAGSDKDIFESYMKTVRAAEVHSISDSELAGIRLHDFCGKCSCFG